MICDCHIHFMPSELSPYISFYGESWSDKNKLFAFLDDNDIEAALLTYPSSDAYIKLGSFRKACDIYNAAIREIIKEDNRVYAAGIVDMDNLSSSGQQVERLKAKGFRAVSIASSYKGKFLLKELKPLFYSAQENNMPVFVHPQTINPIGFERVKDPLLMPVLEYSFDISIFMGLLIMNNFMLDYKTKLIFSSLGGVMPFLKERLDRVYTMLRSRGIVKDLGRLPGSIMKAFYVDTSGAPLENVKLALQLFGEDKILWGSDYPVCGDVQSRLKSLDLLGGDLKEKIICSNFKALFNS